MEGVEDHSIKPPLVVLDGANIAYDYANAMQGTATSSLAVATGANRNRTGNRTEPAARGIRVACRYFQDAGIRVLVVLPASWFRVKPRPNDPTQTNAMMQTDQLDVLHDLRQEGLLVAAPPADDDDSYALTIAQRESSRRGNHTNSGGNGDGRANLHEQRRGYVLSNDLFRDAQRRDTTGNLERWLKCGDSDSSQSGGDGGGGPGRISFAFGDMGTIDQYGDRELDIIPNPRHPLVAWVEQQHQQKS